MIIKWYNRDSISDRDMIRAKLVADRLMGRNTSPVGTYAVFIDPVISELAARLNRTLENVVIEREAI